MLFPSLSVLTTLACATFSFAAPLNPVPIPAAVVDEIGNSLTTRDTPSSPLVVALSGLFVDLQPALDSVVKCVDGKVTAEVDTKEVKSAVAVVVAVVASHVENIKNAALVSVNDVEALVVGKLLVQIIGSVYKALSTVASVPGVVQEALTPVIDQVTVHLSEVVVVVTTTVPSVVGFVVTGVTSLYHEVSHLSIAGIFESLGVEGPAS